MEERLNGLINKALDQVEKSIDINDISGAMESVELINGLLRALVNITS